MAAINTLVSSLADAAQRMEEQREIIAYAGRKATNTYAYYRDEFTTLNLDGSYDREVQFSLERIKAGMALVVEDLDRSMIPGFQPVTTAVFAEMKAFAEKARRMYEWYVAKFVATAA